MKEELCGFYSQVITSRGYNFTEAAKVSGMSRSQINNILNHNGREVSIEKIIEGFSGMGYTINFTLEYSQ